MKVARAFLLTALLTLAATVVCQTSTDAVGNSAVSSAPSSQEIHAGTLVLRYVGCMKGPFVLLPLSPTGPAVLRLQDDQRVLEVRLQDIDISMPLMLRSRLIEELVGKVVFFEGPTPAENGDVIAHVYFASADGEWTAFGRQPLAQLNLRLVEAGIAVPASKLDARYAHFYQSSLVRAKADQVGRWSPR